MDYDLDTETRLTLYACRQARRDWGWGAVLARIAAVCRPVRSLGTI